MVSLYTGEKRITRDYSIRVLLGHLRDCETGVPSGDGKAGDLLTRQLNHLNAEP